MIGRLQTPQGICRFARFEPGFLGEFLQGHRAVGVFGETGLDPLGVLTEVFQWLLHAAIMSSVPAEQATGTSVFLLDTLRGDGD